MLNIIDNKSKLEIENKQLDNFPSVDFNIKIANDILNFKQGEFSKIITGLATALMKKPEKDVLRFKTQNSTIEVTKQPSLNPDYTFEYVVLVLEDAAIGIAGKYIVKGVEASHPELIPVVETVKDLVKELTIDETKEAFIAEKYDEQYGSKYNDASKSGTLVIDSPSLVSIDDIKKYLQYSGCLDHGINSIFIKNNVLTYELISYKEILAEYTNRGFYDSATDEMNVLPLMYLIKQANPWIDLNERNIDPIINLTTLTSPSFPFLLLKQGEKLSFPTEYSGSRNVKLYASDLGSTLSVEGATGNDTLFGGNSKDILKGGRGNDILVGNASNDEIHGGVGNDNIFGDGNSYPTDVIRDPNIPLTDSDLIAFERSNDGADSLYGDAGRDFIFGGGGNDYIDGGADNDTLYGGSGTDEIHGGRGNDKIYGDLESTASNYDGNDRLYGDYGNDTIVGGGGIDIIDGGYGNDFIDGGSGNDTIYDDYGNNTINGGKGADLIILGSGNNTIDDTDVNNTVCAGDGNNSINNSYYVYLGDGNNNIKNSGTVYVGDGNNNIENVGDVNAGDGNNTLKLTNGAYGALYAGNGNNTFIAENAMHCGIGFGNGFNKITMKEGGRYLIDVAYNKEVHAVLYAEIEGKTFPLLGSPDLVNWSTSTYRAKDKYGFTYDYSIDSNRRLDRRHVTIQYRSEDGNLVYDIQIYGFENGDFGLNLTGYPPPIGRKDYNSSSFFDKFSTYFNNSFKPFLQPFITEISKIKSIIVGSSCISDPLILDLNGDGIKTTSINAGSRFDFDNDSFSEKSSWIDGFDGFLAIDKNGDGKITNGNELFGNQTVKSDGNIAKSGFEALADYDSNKDGVIDSADARFNNLKILKGYGAVISLAEAGVKSINLNYTDTNLTDKNGNLQQRLCSFEKTDGSFAQIGEYALTSNLSDTKEVSTSTIPLEISILPDISGIGGNKSLHQAMISDITLKNLVIQFKADTNIENRDSIVDSILIQWTGASNVDASVFGNDIDARTVFIVEKFAGDNFITDQENLIISNSDLITSINSSYASLKRYVYAELASQTNLSPLYNLIEVTYDDTSNDIKLDLTTVIDQLNNEITADQVNGRQKVYEFAKTFTALNCKDSSNYSDFYNSFSVIDSDYKSYLDYCISLIIQDSSTDGVISGTNNADFLNGTSANDTIIAGYGNDTINVSAGNDTYVFNKGDGQDLIDFNQYYNISTTKNDIIKFGANISEEDLDILKLGQNLIIKIKDTDDQITINNWKNFSQNATEIISFDDGSVIYKEELESIKNLVNGSESDEYIASMTSNDLINAGKGNDTIFGSLGSDTYLFNRGDGQDVITKFGMNAFEGERSNPVAISDTLKFGAGITKEDLDITVAGEDLVVKIKNTNDQITINNWSVAVGNIEFYDGLVLSIDSIRYKINHTFQGTINNDILSCTSGDNTIIGGLGDDTLYAGGGNDTYIYNIGDGSDIIVENSGVDTISFGDGIEKDSLQFILRLGSDNSNNMEILFENQGDKIEIKDWFQGKTIEKLEFSDGTSMTLDEINSKLSVIIQGTDSSETLYGSEYNDVFIGGKGNDVYTANPYYNTIKGSDTYVFNKGDGADTITKFGSDATQGYVYNPVTGLYEYKTIPAAPHTIKFGNDISANDLEYSKSNGALIISIKNSTDKITINNWANAKGSLQFADGTILTKAQLDTFDIKNTINGTDFNDNLNGTTGSDLIIAGAGNDRIIANAGNDTIIAGTGNDTIDGGSGVDSYTFNKGDGQDFIVQLGSPDQITNWYNSETMQYEQRIISGEADIVKLGEGITRSDLEFSKINGNLVISLKNSTDKITIQNWSMAKGFIQFADGTSMLKSDIDALGLKNIVQGTDNSEYLYGTGDDDSIVAGAGNDYVMARQGNNIIFGGAGADTIYAEEGNDTIIGGVGNDSINGGNGSDTYLFNRGDGQDTISQFGTSESQGYAYNPVTGQYEYMTIPSTLDLIEFGEGITADDVEFSRENGNLVIYVKNSEDKITIQNWSTAYGSIQFSNGTSILKSDIDALNLPNKVIGSVLEDWLSGSSEDDVVAAGLANDTIYGSLGNDTYLFNKGDGQDVIDYTSLSMFPYPDAGTDTIEFGAGIVKDDLDFEVVDDDLVIKIKNSTDKITITNWTSPNKTKINNLKFADGSTITQDEINNVGNKEIIGTMQDDTYNIDDSEITIVENINGGIDTVLSSVSYTIGNNIENITLIGSSNLNATGNELDNYIVGNVGNNLLTGNDGQDTLDGSVGSDTLSGGVGNDTYYVDNIADIIVENANEGIDTVNSSVTYTLSSNVENLALTGISAINGTGNSLSNTIEGNSGNNILSGLDGNDTYLLKSDFGQDAIIDSVGNNIVKFDSVASSDVSYVKQNNDLVISIHNSSNKLTVSNWFTGSQNMTFSYADNSIITSVDVNDILNPKNITSPNGGNSNIVGGAGNDTIYAQYRDTISGGAGSDLITNKGSGFSYLSGGAGNDTIYAKYDDTVFGGSGDDYLSDAGSGFVSISGDEGNDTLYGLYKDTLIGGAGDDYIYDNSCYALLVGGTGNDSLFGQYADTLDGGDGNDYLVDNGGGFSSMLGGSGNDTLLAKYSDTLNGGTGDDVLTSTSGNTTFVFNVGDGQDTITQTAWADNISYGAGIKESDVAIYRQNNDLIIDDGHGDSVRIKNYSTNPISKVSLSNGKFLTSNDVNNIVQKIASFAQSKGISITSINDVKNNQSLMTLVSSAWHS